VYIEAEAACVASPFRIGQWGHTGKSGVRFWRGESGGGYRDRDVGGSPLPPSLFFQNCADLPACFAFHMVAPMFFHL
jgi:hypothetical protein